MRGKKEGLLRTLFAGALICVMMIVLSPAAFAEDSGDSLKDNGIEEINNAYEFTVVTGGDAVGASAGMSYGGWSSLGSKLSYMKFPEGTTTLNGESGLWCYCIDITTSTVNGHKYAMTTLDAADYYKDDVTGKIRAILINSYPHVSIEALEARFGLTNLMEEEAFIATQWILWYYSNPEGVVEAGGGAYYPANIYKPSEYPGDTMKIWYDDKDGNEVAAQSENVVKLAKALDALQPVGAYETEPADINIEKRIYDDKVIFDFGGTTNLEALEDVSITVKDNGGNDIPFALSENRIVVQHKDLVIGEAGVSLTVDIEAVQKLSEDAYFFSPEGGRNASQARVAVSDGVVPVSDTADYVLSQSNFEEAPKDAQLKVNKSVLLDGKAYKTENVYYVALFDDKECSVPAKNGAVREIRMGGESFGTVTFDELEPGKTYYVAETNADGTLLKNGDLGIETIAYDKQEVVVSPENIVEVIITNCYVEQEKPDEEEPGGGMGDGGISEEDPDEKKPVSEGPDTGEDPIMVLWAMMALTSLAIMGLVLLLNRKKVYR